jgi:carotenoid 1,2-hydratase
MSNVIECAKARGGYAWWYVEAHDTVDKRYGLTLILFAGSVFSPFYAERLRRGEPAIGLEHPAVNLALYERTGGTLFPHTQRLWAMNEYPPSALQLDERRIAIDRSFIEYGPDGSARIELHEETTYFFGDPGPPLDATLRVSAPRLPDPPLELGKSAAGEAHYWQPLVAVGDAEVELVSGPLKLRFSGLAYCDRNFGSGRLEDAFTRWSWAHGVDESTKEARRALLLYHAQRRDGGVTGLTVSYRRPDAPPEVLRDGVATRVQAPSLLQRGFLWLPVPTRVSVAEAVCERQRGGRLEDAPFYARYLARLADRDGSYLGVGEYLDLDRFRSRAVQELLTFKTHKVPA